MGNPVAKTEAIAIDTMTLIWGIRKDGPDEQQKRAKFLFQKLEEEKAQVIVPAIVVAEYLVPVRQDERDRVAALLGESFRVVPFDIRCTVLAAQIFGQFKKGKASKTVGGRDLLKADAMIVASAKAAGASVFYTDDKRCRKMAGSVMEARGLPDIPSNLFGYKA